MKAPQRSFTQEELREIGYRAVILRDWNESGQESLTESALHSWFECFNTDIYPETELNAVWAWYVRIAQGAPKETVLGMWIEVAQ